MCRRRVSSAVAPLNGGRPVTSSNASTPRPYTSDLGDARCPQIRSGLRYSGGTSTSFAGVLSDFVERNSNSLFLERRQYGKPDYGFSVFDNSLYLHDNFAELSESVQSANADCNTSTGVTDSNQFNPMRCCRSGRKCNFNFRTGWSPVLLVQFAERRHTAPNPSGGFLHVLHE